MSGKKIIQNLVLEVSRHSYDSKLGATIQTKTRPGMSPSTNTLLRSGFPTYPTPSRHPPQKPLRHATPLGRPPVSRQSRVLGRGPNARPAACAGTNSRYRAHAHHSPLSWCSQDRAKSTRRGRPRARAAPQAPRPTRPISVHTHIHVRSHGYMHVFGTKGTYQVHRCGRDGRVLVPVIDCR